MGLLTHWQPSLWRKTLLNNCVCLSTKIRCNYFSNAFVWLSITVPVSTFVCLHAPQYYDILKNFVFSPVKCHLSRMSSIILQTAAQKLSMQKWANTLLKLQDSLCLQKKAPIHTQLNLSGQPWEPDQHVSGLLNAFVAWAMMIHLLNRLMYFKNWQFQW